MPPDLTIRPAQIEDAPAMARVHVETWRTTYVGIVPEAHLAGLSTARSQARWVERLSDPQGERAFVAVDPTGLVVGLASGGPARDAVPGYDGELYVLYILKAFQGVGCGRRLVARVARMLADSGCRALLLWVLKDNPSRGFYERLGGRLVGEKTVEIGGTPLVDVGYGWPDLTALL